MDDLIKVVHTKEEMSLWHGTSTHTTILQLSSPEFYTQLKYHFPDLKFQRKVNTAMMGAWSFIFFIGIILFISGYFLLPIVMSKAADLIPQKTETEIGRKMLQTFLKGEQIDAAKTKAINKFYSKLKINTRYKIHLTVVKADIKNAFALPGGEIVVYDKMIHSMHSYQELAALVGHESGHIQQRHSLRLLIKNLSWSLLAGSVIGEYGGITSALAGKVHELAQLSYSRQAETEADDFAFDVMIKNGMNPAAIITLFRHLKEKDSVENTVPDFMMTHPKIDVRIKAIEDKIKGKRFKVLKHDDLAFYWNIII